MIETVLAGKDALAVMPTGGGKSLCYQVPALVNPGITIVVSPLIALMKDQVRLLRGKGIAAGCLYSGQTYDEKRIVFGEMARSQNFILYISPERVQNPGFAQWLPGKPVRLFAIDEAHCVSQWGPEFRQDYHRLSLLRQLRPDVPVLALTATATPEVLADIVRQLGLRHPDRHVYGFYRPNLFYQVEVCEDESEKREFLEEALARFPQGRVIVYCGTRAQCEELVSELKSKIKNIDYYHAGLSTEDRNEVQRRYETGEIRVLAATNAFGMGIDHPDVRLVVHYQMPANIESLYQEMGRAGRDGNDSTCLVLYSKKDKGLHSFFIRQSDAGSFEINRRWRSLDTIVQFVEGGECRHSGILTYFKDTQRIRRCGHCDSCEPLSPRKVPRTSWGSRGKSRTKSAENQSGSHAPKGRSKKSEGESALTALSAKDKILYDSLKQWRKNYADEHDLPAFVVFSDKTLRDLVQKKPKTLVDVGSVYGFGPHKTERLGKMILEQIKPFEV